MESIKKMLQRQIQNAEQAVADATREIKEAEEAIGRHKRDLRGSEEHIAELNRLLATYDIVPVPRTEGEMHIPEPRAVGQMVANVTPFKGALARVRAVLEEEIADAARKSVQVGHLVVKLDKSEVMEAIGQARAQVEEEIAKAKADRVNRDVRLMAEHATISQCHGRLMKGRMVVLPYKSLTAPQRMNMPRVWCEIDELDA